MKSSEWSMSLSHIGFSDVRCRRWPRGRHSRIDLTPKFHPGKGDGKGGGRIVDGSRTLTNGGGGSAFAPDKSLHFA